jgi:sulfate-transporting ATPase
MAGLAASGFVGFLIQMLIMRPLSDASPLTKVVSTLGILVILESAAYLRYPNQAVAVTSSLPINPVRIFGANIGENQLIILGLTVILIAALSFVYRTTVFGLSTAAVAENPTGASLLGISPNKVATVNWTLGSMLAALAGILLVPISGLDVAGLTLLIVPALAAAMVGQLSSFPMMLVGGLVIGIAESLVSRYVNSPGWEGAVPFLLVLLVLIIRGKASIPARGVIGTVLPTLGSGLCRPWAVGTFWVVSFVMIRFWFGQNWVSAATIEFGVGIILLSLVVLTGYAGQLSLAQLTFAGVGTLVAAHLVIAGVPFEFAILGGLVATIPIGLLVGLAAARTRGPTLAIATLLLSDAFASVVFTNTTFVGPNGFSTVGPQSLFGIHIDAIAHPVRYAVLLLSAFVVVGCLVANLRRGRVGRRLIAVRGNERAAAALGISVRNVKLYAFVLSGILAGLGGILLAFQLPSIGYTGFDPFSSINEVVYSVVGGVGWVAGSFFGATLSSGAVGTTATTLLGPGINEYVPLAGGVLLLITILTSRDGVAAIWASYARRTLGRLPFRSPPSHGIDLTGSVNQGGPVSKSDRSAKSNAAKSERLAASSLTVSFGGVAALRDVTFHIDAGEVVGVIGPNGAGKTTLIDAITGFVKGSGSVCLEGRELRCMSPERRQRLGLSRSFQSLELFDDLSVLGNLRVASDRTVGWHYVTDLVWPGRPHLAPSALVAIEEFALEDDLGRSPKDLSYGKRRLVAIARAVASQPSVLLLDEPAAGLDDTEVRELSGLIRGLASARGMGVLLVEHHVDMVMECCDRIYVLQFGQVVASGTPDEIIQNPKVREAYLGASIRVPSG